MNTSGEGIRTAYGVIPNYVDGETPSERLLPSRDVASDPGKSIPTYGAKENESSKGPLKKEKIVKEEMLEEDVSEKNYRICKSVFSYLPKCVQKGRLILAASIFASFSTRCGMCSTYSIRPRHAPFSTRYLPGFLRHRRQRN